MASTQAAGLNPGGTALVLLCALMTSAQAVAEEPVGPVPFIVSSPEQEAIAPLDFDIAAQSLATALQRYALISGRPALFSSAMVAGRSATAVRGRYTPQAALDILLEGSGLIAQNGKHGPADAFVLIPRSAQPDARQADADGLNRDYGGWVQARVWQALCADARTAPGGYRVLLRFGVDAAGQVRQARLLTSSGSARRDAAVLATLEQVHVDRSPPRDMEQPLTMILLPRDPAHPDGKSCDSTPGGTPGGTS